MNAEDYEDRMLVCKDCLSEFLWSAGEQDYYATRTPPLTQPRRCVECRRARKAERTDYRD
jgi:hypothetical protein